VKFQVMVVCARTSDRLDLKSWGIVTKY